MKNKLNIILFTAFTCLIITACENKQDELNIADEKIMKTDTVKNEIYTDINNVTGLKINNQHSAAENKSDKTKNKNQATDTVKSGKDNIKLIAYYFHPAARCVTCKNIEAYSIEAIQSWEEKTGNKVIWKELNIEDSVNEHYIKDYNLEFSSLVLTQYANNKRVKWKILADTWKLVNEKSKFLKYVNFELNQFVKK